MKIATFNINGIRRRLPNLLEWLEAKQPDIVSLQELKAERDEFPHAALAELGYQAIWRGQKSWNGVAILARGATPVLIRSSLPGDPEDKQSRYIEAAINGIIVTSLYLPNGNPQPGPKFEYKMRWFERLLAHAMTLIAAKVPVVLCGDFNVVPTDRDIYATRSWKRDALLQPRPRAAFRQLADQGWTDSLRHLHPDSDIYTFWDYFRNHFERDAGLRIDHLLVSPTLTPRLLEAGVDREVRGQKGASDHAPTWIVLAEGGAKKKPRNR